MPRSDQGRKTFFVLFFHSKVGEHTDTFITKHKSDSTPFYTPTGIDHQPKFQNNAIGRPTYSMTSAKSIYTEGDTLKSNNTIDFA